MCDPLSIAVAGAVASGAGGLIGGMQKQGYDQAVRRSELEAYQASRDARLAERERQQEFEQDGSDFWTRTAEALSADQMALDEATAQATMMNTIEEMPDGTPEGFLLSGQDNASDEIKGEIARRTSEAAGEARKRVAALAKLSGQDAAGSTRALQLGEGADFLSMLNGLRRGSLGVSQFEQTIPAEYVAPPDMLFADILSGGGAALTGAARPGGMFGNGLPVY